MEGRTIIKRGLIVIGIAIVAGYSYFALEGYVRGPRIELTDPTNGASTTTARITITGRAVHVNTLTINGATTSPDLAGNFRESLLLAPGYNIMKVAAEDRYGRTVEKTIEMTLVVPQPPTSPEGTSTTTPQTSLESATTTSIN
jgi:hypothetical protein